MPKDGHRASDATAVIATSWIESRTEAQVANAAHHHALNQSTDGNAHPVSEQQYRISDEACSQRPWPDL